MLPDVALYPYALAGVGAVAFWVRGLLQVHPCIHTTLR